ncbi:hypothetical protein PG459_005011, partial [Salmonella enterica]|nr:hypothetical protein [Salmonella enterica]
QSIIDNCQDPILALPENGHLNALVFTTLPTSARVKCGTDVETALQPFVTIQNVRVPTEAEIDATVTSTPVGWYSDNGRVDPANPGAKRPFSMRAYLDVDVSRKGGVKYQNETYIVKGTPKYPFAHDTINGHPAASAYNVPTLVVTDKDPYQGTGGYRAIADPATFVYMQYVPSKGYTYIDSSVGLIVEGNYTSVPDATGTQSTITDLIAELRVDPGNEHGVPSPSLMVTTGDDLPKCVGDVGQEGWIISVPAKTAFSCVSNRRHSDVSYVYQKLTADDLFGSTTHPALSGVWRFYMDVQ